MPIQGTNGASVELDAISCEVNISGHYLNGTAIPVVDPPLPEAVWDYLNTAQDTLYNWNPVTRRWNLDYSHVHNIQEYSGGIADGVSDNTAAAQAAVDAMPATGGILYLPPMDKNYRISTVSITKPVMVVGGGLGATRIKKFGGAGVAERAIFDMRDVLGIGFSMSGLSFDLNGEGSERMGGAGRIANQTAVAGGITSISGPPNSAVFALRCSRIHISNCKIEHTAEVGLLFRNCADVWVNDCTFYNTANGGIEFSFPSVSSDGGFGTVPQMSNYHVHNCTFIDIDDFGLGSRNAVGVSLAGNAVNTAIENVFITNNSFDGCQRDIHVELQNTSRVERFRFSDNTMINSRQGSIAIIRGRDGEIHNNTIINPCGAPTAALNPGFPEMYVFYIAVGDNVSWKDNRVYDRRGTRSVRVVGDAAMVAGGNTVTTTLPTFFDTSIVGTWFGVLGAGPDGSPLVGKVVAVVSPFEVSLSVPAQTTVTNADFAYGGAIRRGFVARVSNNAFFQDNIMVGAGNYSNLSHGATLEPPSYAVYLADIFDFAIVRGNIIRAASDAIIGSDSPEGIFVTQAFTTQGMLYVRGNSVQGYDENHSGFQLTEPLVKHAHVGRRWFLQPVYPSASAGVYGTQLDFAPLDTGFDMIVDFEIEVDGMAVGEVVDVHVRSLLNNGGDQNVTVNFTSNQAVRFSAQRLALINRDNRIITYFYVETRSSIAGSAARARITALALEH